MPMYYAFLMLGIWPTVYLTLSAPEQTLDYSLDRRQVLPIKTKYKN